MWVLPLVHSVCYLLISLLLSLHQGVSANFSPVCYLLTLLCLCLPGCEWCPLFILFATYWLLLLCLCLPGCEYSTLFIPSDASWLLSYCLYSPACKCYYVHVWHLIMSPTLYLAGCECCPLFTFTVWWPLLLCLYSPACECHPLFV